MVALEQSIPSSSTPSTRSLPALSADGPPVDPARCTEPGTATAKLVGYAVGAVSGLVLVLVTYGVALLALLLSPLINWYFNRRAAALIKGSGVRITARQLPEIHHAVETLARRLGMQIVPDVYLVEDNVLNAAAVKFGKRDVILLTDDIIDACLRTGNFDALLFVLGHELAHVALGHNGSVQSYISRVYRKLSRLNEYTCDRVAMQLLRSKDTAAHEILLLTAGPHMLPYINVSELADQAREVFKDSYSVKAEKQLTHPLILHRLHRVLNQSSVN